MYDVKYWMQIALYVVNAETRTLPSLNELKSLFTVVNTAFALSSTLTVEAVSTTKRACVVRRTRCLCHILVVRHGVSAVETCARTSCDSLGTGNA